MNRIIGQRRFAFQLLSVLMGLRLPCKPADINPVPGSFSGHLRLTIKRILPHSPKPVDIGNGAVFTLKRSHMNRVKPLLTRRQPQGRKTDPRCEDQQNPTDVYQPFPSVFRQIQFFSPNRVAACGGIASHQSNLHTIDTILNGFEMIVARLDVLRAAEIRFLSGGPVGSQHIDAKSRPSP